MILPEVTEIPEDRLVLFAQDPDNHDEWNAVLPKAMPQFLYHDESGKALVRWTMTKEQAQAFGMWGAGCSCCGTTGIPDEDSEIWEFDTNHDQTSWYTDALGVPVHE